MGIQNYEELKVWQKAMDLVDAIYDVVELFPRKEQYRLTDQLCRAAISIPSNIAEGSSRKSTKEFIRFLNISHGSLAEVGTQLRIAERRSYINSERLAELVRNIEELCKMLHGLQSALITKLQTLDSRL